jgi:hypothetical protein
VGKIRKLSPGNDNLDSDNRNLILLVEKNREAKTVPRQPKLIKTIIKTVLA